MAKKSTATRQANAARRSQTTSKGPQVTLVRPAKDQAVSTAAASSTTTDTMATTATTATTARTRTATSTPTKLAATPTPRPVVAPTRPRIPEAPKPAPSRAVVAKTENATRPVTKSQQSARVARAKATHRARTANRVTPEHYAYVRNDLRLIFILAASMFAIIIILHFILPNFLPQ